MFPETPSTLKCAIIKVFFFILKKLKVYNINLTQLKLMILFFEVAELNVTNTQVKFVSFRGGKRVNADTAVTVSVILVVRDD